MVPVSGGRRDLAGGQSNSWQSVVARRPDSTRSASSRHRCGTPLRTFPEALSVVHHLTSRRRLPASAHRLPVHVEAAQTGIPTSGACQRRRSGLPVIVDDFSPPHRLTRILGGQLNPSLPAARPPLPRDPQPWAQGHPRTSPTLVHLQGPSQPDAGPGHGEPTRPVNCNPCNPTCWTWRGSG